MPTYIFNADGVLIDKKTGKPDPLPKKFVMPRIMVVRDYEGYQCPVTDKWIEGRKAHSENLKRTGCRLLEKGEHEHAARERKDADKRLEKTIDVAVEKTVAQLGI